MSGFDKRIVVAALIIVVGLAQAGLAGVAYYWRGQTSSDLETAKDDLDLLNARIDLARARPELTATSSESQWRLAAGPDASRTLEALQGIADSVEVRLPTLEVLKSRSEGKRSFRIKGTAAPARVCALVAAIEELEELVVVETGSILPADGESVTFDLGLATYHATQGGPR